MNELRAGRGKPVRQHRWPESGAERNWLAFCNKVRRENGSPSLRALQKEMHLAATRIGELLRGEGLPVNEDQARALLVALGAMDSEIAKGADLYRAARAERDRVAADTAASAWWLRSGYVGQVSDIAPLDLLGRQAELEELAEWCAAGNETYAWWQAEPRAGKSALMAWLVLHPPPGVWVVSFFVTARLAGQADSAAFTDSLLDQLTAVTGEQIPPVTSAAARDGLRRRLLEEAAARAVKTSRQLVLLVDGLDEDCGSLPGSGLASIAACLPKRLPAGLRVLVAGRPDPPVPADVDTDHPLRHCRVRRLSVSPDAAQAAELAQRELDEVLATDNSRHDGLGYEVLGLVTACGGGLSRRDLQELTGQPPFQVDRLMRGVFGRTIADRTSPDAGARVFLFTHETLREQAIRCLGPGTLAGFAARLHTWASGYRDRGWPAGTPAYLLRGYPRMLADAGEIDRLVALATDPVRHHRMLDGTGGDVAALAEIAAAHALISTSQSPDLLAALRLAWHRDQLADRNARIPAQLPALWAAIGQPVRAEALARSITNPDRQARALAGVAAAAAAGGDCDRALELADDAEQIAQSITDRGSRARALAGVAAAAAAGGNCDRALRLAADAEQITRSQSISNYSQQWARTLNDVARTAAAAGDCDRVLELTANAEQIVRSQFTGYTPYEQALALADVATMAALAGDYARAEQIAQSITNQEVRARALACVAAAVAAGGDRDRALELAADAEQITQSRSSSNYSGDRARALADVATVIALAGDYARAEQIAQSITNQEVRARALACVAAAVAAGGDRDLARDLATDSERIARSTSTDPVEQGRPLADVAMTAALAGDYDRAEQITQSITWADMQARAVADVATAAAIARDYDRAERIAQSITNSYVQAQAVADVARTAAVAGDYARARELAAEAERIAQSITEPYAQSQALVSVATAAAAARDDGARKLAADAGRIARDIFDPLLQDVALIGVVTATAAAGDYDRAERIAQSITEPLNQAKALGGVVEATTAACDYGRARKVAADAERIAQSITTDTPHQVHALITIVRATAAIGDYDRAERIAGSTIFDPYVHAVARGQALLFTVEAAAAAGDHDRAERIAWSITESFMQAQALATVASSVEQARARSCIAGALAAGRWTVPLKALARVDPVTLSSFAAELTAPSGPSVTPNSGPVSATSTKTVVKRSDALLRPPPR